MLNGKLSILGIVLSFLAGGLVVVVLTPFWQSSPLAPHVQAQPSQPSSQPAKPPRRMRMPRAGRMGRPPRCVNYAPLAVAARRSWDPAWRQ